MAKARPETNDAPTAVADNPETDAPVAPGDANTPVVEEAGRKNKRPKKVKYRTSKDPKLTDFPADWDPEKHLALDIEDFDNHAPLLEWRADQYEAKAKECREEAKELRALGTAAQRKAHTRLKGIKDEIGKLVSTLGDTEVNMEAILAEIAAQCVTTDGE